MVRPVRVAIVERNRLVREGLAAALAQDSGIQVVGTAADSEDLLSVPRELDVVVVDLGLPGRGGLAHIRAINEGHPRAAIVVTGLGELEGDVLAVCEAGATSFLHQNASLQELSDRLHAAARGETPCTPRVAALLSARLRQRVRDLERVLFQGRVHLTPRELEVIHLIGQKLSNKEIAAKLEIEVQTVKNHVHNILEKLGLPGRYAVARYARENGILPAGARGPSVRPGLA